MALNANMTIKGQKQGNINGSVTQKGRENSIAVHAIDHLLSTPRDEASGLPTGKRMHKPFVITKEIDKSSPLLYAALVANESLSCQIQYWTAPAGTVEGAIAEKQVYSVTLTNANVASIEQRMFSNFEQASSAMPYQEFVAFTYEKIQWTWVDGGITFSDEWEAPVA